MAIQQKNEKQTFLWPAEPRVFDLPRVGSLADRLEPAQRAFGSRGYILCADHLYWEGSIIQKWSFNGGSGGIEVVFFNSVAVKEPIKPIKPCMFSIESMTWNETRYSTNTRNICIWLGVFTISTINLKNKHVEMGEMARRSAPPCEKLWQRRQFWGLATNQRKVSHLHHYHFQCSSG